MSTPARSAITVALQHAFFPALDTPERHLRLVRPRTVVDAVHAGQVLRLADRNRDLLPRWGINSPIRDHGVQPGAYTGTTAWTSREHWLHVTVPAAIATRPEILAGHHVDPDTFRRWCATKSLYSQEQHSGRTVIVRPDTIAGLMQASLSTVHRCQRAARILGLEIVLIPGRMLTEIECHRARKQGSPQRGLSTVSAFIIPSWLPHPVTNDTPTRGTQLHNPVADIRTLKQRSARPKRAPLRSARRQRKGRPVCGLARELTTRVIFLHKCPPGRITNQLRRYETATRPWRGEQLIRAMDNINIRLGYTAPIRPKTAPWGLLAWYLHQIDPTADHPNYEGSFPESNLEV